MQVGVTLFCSGTKVHAGTGMDTWEKRDEPTFIREVYLDQTGPSFLQIQPESHRVERVKSANGLQCACAAWE